MTADEPADEMGEASRRGQGTGGDRARGRSGGGGPSASEGASRPEGSPSAPRPADGPLSVPDPPIAAPHAEDTQNEANRVARARRLLEAAIRKSPAATPAAPMAPGSTPRVDKYFGEKLPPVCSRLGCYLTDDGKRFYCINHACQKHLKRETKHTRRGNPVLKTPIVYFRCPRCESRNITMHVLSNRYSCRACLHSWAR